MHYLHETESENSSSSDSEKQNKYQIKSQKRGNRKKKQSRGWGNDADESGGYRNYKHTKKSGRGRNNNKSSYNKNIVRVSKNNTFDNQGWDEDGSDWGWNSTHNNSNSKSSAQKRQNKRRNDGNNQISNNYTGNKSGNSDGEWNSQNWGGGWENNSDSHNNNNSIVGALDSDTENSHYGSRKNENKRNQVYTDSMYLEDSDTTRMRVEKRQRKHEHRFHNNNQDETFQPPARYSENQPSRMKGNSRGRGNFKKKNHNYQRH